MRIGVHSKELENARIDGTMVYLSHVLRGMQDLIGDDDLYLYHTKKYHAQLPQFAHAHVQDRILPSTPLWTQTACAAALWRDACDVLWMPIHNVPYIRRSQMRTVVTIHDLAFKLFPRTYPTADRIKLDLLTDHAVKVADALIAVSAATKKDLLAYYPFLQEQHIHVIHHGFDPMLWQQTDDRDRVHRIMNRYHVQEKNYVIHVGAIQPRKNLALLVDAFEHIKVSQPQYKLVLVGGDGWLARELHEKIARSAYAADIIVTGNIAFDHVRTLVQHATVCVLPSLYEGFGMPGLEAMASAVPVVAARSSCFPEILGNGAVYFDPHSAQDCARVLLTVITDQKIAGQLSMRGQKRSALFSWEKCAQETLAVLRHVL